ncbi:tRNA uridine-5-carboxymethylaminomethyl(34) synthesis GTPase MnmE [Marseilla massiliensis]|uniref:tRNA modification GTPase MnmE n=1 Tax=Marseilla massiliensis TaxID=1841864 RepID=A0A938WT38_9BACT|nr:tRNA uridine-5-carboxymethylaminomethyl(34) synthesis GTPase MnmE [Marseilla massiliensis]MBM6673728.1 tRNA uridine-5-carboxymethylaminomethyl(34) synthesis GTPase MnmE [Marseilla massiliensis]
MNKEETICAIATGRGGALGIIRVSGPNAIINTDKIFIPADKTHKLLSERKAYTISYGHITNKDGEIIDEVLVSLFRAPHSYTGENCTEISCHGSEYILKQIMQMLIDNGCRAANPGEFTQRAFLNGKMDLSQAEAVADLIASSSKATHRIAMNQMRGNFSHELKTLRDKLLHLTSLIELELDFSDHEDLEFADRKELKETSLQISTVISKLINSFSLGNAIKNGIPVAIIGETNAGKSTLLNTLSGDDRAIVSDIDGTTRDVIEDTININGTTFRFIDTAGIRETHDTIEAMGIERSFKALNKAEIVILMYDLQRKDNFLDFYEKIHQHLINKQVILAMNKCDIVPESNIKIPEIIKISSNIHWHTITISAKSGTNIEQLRNMLCELSCILETSNNDIIITNVRHYEALTKALNAINRVEYGLTTSLTGDLIAQDLRECLFHLNDILGEVTTGEILHNIFKHFCIGK